MTCYNCIHFDNCLNNGKTRYYGADIACGNVEEHCNFFKKKADLVDVVRCEECEIRGTGDCPFVYYSEYEGFVDPTEDDDFCSYGERKEGAE